MSSPSHSPGSSGGLPSAVFTRAQRQVLAFLSLHSDPVAQPELVGSVVLAMGTGVVEVLFRRGLVDDTNSGWVLTPFARALMDLGFEVGGLCAQDSLEGVRHVR